MEVKRSMAGSLESNDVLVVIDPLASEGQPVLVIESTVEERYGLTLRQLVQDVLASWSIAGVQVRLQDRGALPFTVRARLETALSRATEGGPE